MFNNNYNKFMASAAAVALVATAVAPVAGAEATVTPSADSLFSDVPSTYTHFDAINKAVEYELLSGYQDGTFKPYQGLTRANVVKALGKYILASEGKKITDYDLSKVKPFNDVKAGHPDSELYNFSLLVKQAGIFTGSNNNLMPTNKIQRQQLAKVLVKAFGFEELAGNSSKVTDNNLAYAEFVPYINILSENGITDVAKFMPAETTTRGQLASFLVRSFENVYEGIDEAIADLEEAIGGFEGLAKDYGIEIDADPAADNTFIITLPAELPEEVGGTGFFDTLAAKGVETLNIGGKDFTISDGKGNVTAGAGDVKTALLTALYTKNTVEVIVELPYNDTASIAIPYTFNLKK